MKLTLFKLITVSIFAAFMLVTFTPVPHTHAAPTGLTLNVNDTADLPDADPNDNKCLTANSKCTLRAAIQQANASSGQDVINLQMNTTYQLTRAGADDTALNGDLDITEPVLLNGNNATIDANGAVTNDRAFHVHSTPYFAYTIFTDLRIKGGKSGDRGGAILNQAVLALVSARVYENYAQVSGGGIATDYYLFVQKSTIEYNACGCSNPAGTGGGGIENKHILAIAQSTLNSNTSHNHGGGIFSSSGSVSIVASTFYGNAAYRDGGAVYNKGTVNLQAVTMAVNIADYDHDDVGGGGGIYNAAGEVTLTHTLLADNLNVESFLFFGDDCVGTLKSDGYNLVGETANCTIPAANNKLNVAPNLGNFSDHGGPTKTIDLDSDSPALDGGNPNNCNNPEGPSLPGDQREHFRIVNGDGDAIAVCDIGALEANAKQKVMICNAKPTDLSLRTPAPGKKLKSVTQVIMGFGADCATRHDVMIRYDSPTGKRADKVKGLGFGTYLTKALEPKHKYYWRIKACNEIGCTKSDWQWFKLK